MMGWGRMGCTRVSQCGVRSTLGHAMAETVKRQCAIARLRQVTRACAEIVVPQRAASAVVTTAYSVRSHGCSNATLRSASAVQVACSPHPDNCDETISTLRCADARSERIVHWADHRHAHGCTKQPLKAVGIAKPSRSRPGPLTFDRFAQRAKQIKNAVKANVNRSNAELEKLVRADGFDRAKAQRRRSSARFRSWAFVRSGAIAHRRGGAAEKGTRHW